MLSGFLPLGNHSIAVETKGKEVVMSNTGHAGVERAHDVQIASGAATLEGELSVPAGAQGVVLFAHGSGSSRYSPRNQYVARVIHAAGVGTLLFDLLTREEEAVGNLPR